MRAPEVIAVAFVYLTIRQNILCWPTGLIQVLLYIVRRVTLASLTQEKQPD